MSLSYNKFNTHYSDIYRVDFVKTGDGAGKSATVTCAAGPAIAKDIPVEAVARLYGRTGILAAQDGAGAGARGGTMKRFEEQNVFFADNALSKIFTMHWREGRAAGALTQVNSIVLTRAMAQKYFGDGPALGKSLLYDNSNLLQVTGVVDSMPANSDIRFDGLISFETLYTVESKPVARFHPDQLAV